MTLSLLGVYTAGILTFVTPCVLPLIPIYFSMLLGGVMPQGGQLDMRRWRLFLHTSLFSLGFLVVFVALGLSATAFGHLLSSRRELLLLLGGLVIFLFGLKFIGYLRIDWLEREKRLDDRKLGLGAGALNSVVMGIVFALGWTPCVGPILGAVLTYTASQTSNPMIGASYLALYGAGFATPLLIASLGAGWAVPLLRRVMSWLPRIEKATGLLLIGVGLYLMIGVIRVPASTPTAKKTSQPNPISQVIQQQQKKPPINIGAPSERPRLVEFISPNCPICRQMIPVVGAIQRECAYQRNLVDVIKIDISLPEYRDLAKKFNIRGVPTFLFLNRQGQEVARLVGYQRMQNLRQALAMLTGDVCAGVGVLQPQAAPPPAAPSSALPAARIAPLPTAAPAADANESGFCPSEPTPPPAVPAAPPRPIDRPTSAPSAATPPEPRVGSACPSATRDSPGECKAVLP